MFLALHTGVYTRAWKQTLIPISDDHAHIFTQIPLDLDQGRLDMAAKLGADQTILVDTRDVQEMVKRIHTALGEEPDITIRVHRCTPGRPDRNLCELPPCLLICFDSEGA